MASLIHEPHRERFVTQTVGNVTTSGHGARTEIRLDLRGTPDKKNREIREWLAPWNGSQVQRMKTLRERAYPGTGAWLVDNALPKLLEGKADSLCFHGRVGSGKSTLHALSIQAYRLLGKDSDSYLSLLVVPAVFAFDLDYTHNPEFLLRTILATFCTLKDVPSEIAEEFKPGNDPLEIPGISRLPGDIIGKLDAQAKKQTPQRENYANPHSRPISIMLILDAIDELPAQIQRKIWDTLDKLSALNRTLRHIRIRTILFVRTGSMIHDHYANNLSWAMHEISKTRVNADIHMAVTGRLADHSSLFSMIPADRQQVVAAIAARVDGMFRLAALYCDEIDQLQRSTATVQEILDLVSDLPDQLYDFYDRILERITDKRLQKYIVRTLWFLRVDGHKIDQRVPTAFSSICYQSWFSWFIRIVDDPVSSDDIFKHLSGLVSRQIYYTWPRDVRDIDTESIQPSDQSITVELSHFSVAEYLEVAASRKTLRDLGWKFPSNTVLVSRHYRIYLHLLAFRILRIISPESTLRNEDCYRFLHNYWNTHRRLFPGLGLSWRLAATRWRLEWFTWEIMCLPIDIVMNISCAYIRHPRRCWNSSLLLSFLRDINDEETDTLFLSSIWNLALWCQYSLVIKQKSLITWDFTTIFHRNGPISRLRNLPYPRIEIPYCLFLV